MESAKIKDVCPLCNFNDNGNDDDDDGFMSILDEI
jgi:hypothetical protein